LPLFARAMSMLAIQGFDVVIASTAGFGHFVRPRDGCLIAYCHTPPRFLWDERYDIEGMAPAWARLLLPPTIAAMRRADKRAAARVHTYLANSKFVARRIAEVYERRSFVINPPVETTRFVATGERGDYYLMVGRLLPHRNMDLVVRAFTAMDRPLVVVGDGPIAGELRAMAGPRVRFEGVVSDARLASLYAGSRGVVVAGEEDFGIVPLEANAAGKPVVALRKGGVLETVADGFNGVLFDGESVASITQAIERADALRFDEAMMRAHAQGYSEETFIAAMREQVAGASACLECARSRRGRADGSPGG